MCIKPGKTSLKLSPNFKNDNMYLEFNVAITEKIKKKNINKHNRKNIFPQLFFFIRTQIKRTTDDKALCESQ